MDDPQARAGGDAAGGAASDDPESQARSAAAPVAAVDDRAFQIGVPDDWTDELTGVDGPRFWGRMLKREGARVRRYRRPATVALVQLSGLDRLAGQWGLDLAEQALRACGKAIAKEARTSDYVARVEGDLFALLLTETTEIAAINFVERARVACEKAMGSSGGLVTIGFGWASPPQDGDLADAVALARTRLAAELASD